jgi:hypothetical protein
MGRSDTEIYVQDRLGLSPDADLWYVEDDISGSCYLQVSSPETRVAGEVLRAAESELSCWTREDLFRAVDEANDPLDLGLALLRLGLGAPVSVDEEIQSRIADEFYNEFEEVRDMAVWASSYAPLRQYLPDLEEVARNDESEKVRDSGIPDRMELWRRTRI